MFLSLSGQGLEVSVFWGDFVLLQERHCYMGALCSLPWLGTDWKADTETGS